MGSLPVRRKGAVFAAVLAGASVFAFTVPVAQARPLVQGDVCVPGAEGCPTLIGDLSLEKHVDDGTTPTPGFDLVADPLPVDATVSDGVNDSGIFLSTDEATLLTLSGYAQNNDITPDLDVFIGEVLRDGFVFDGVSCSNDVPTDSGYEFRSADQVGRVFRLVPLRGESAPQCAIKNLSATIGLTKTVAPTSVAPGANVVFTLTATNTGNSTLYDGVLADVLPSGMTFVSAVGGAGVACDATAPVRCDLDDVEPGGIRTATVTATVGAGVADASTLTNAASVTALAPRWTPDLCIFDRLGIPTFARVTVAQLIVGEDPECNAPAFVVGDEAAATVTAVVPTTSTTSTTTTASPTTTEQGVQPPAPTTLPPISGILPETGGGETDLAIIAASAVVLGGLLLLVRRRRPGHA